MGGKFGMGSQRERYGAKSGTYMYMGSKREA